VTVRQAALSRARAEGSQAFRRGATSRRWGCPSASRSSGSRSTSQTPTWRNWRRRSTTWRTSADPHVLPTRGRPRLQLRLPAHETPEWRELFGPSSAPTGNGTDRCPLTGTSSGTSKLVRAEAPGRGFRGDLRVWLTPVSRWRARYRDWPHCGSSNTWTASRVPSEHGAAVRLASTDITWRRCTYGGRFSGQPG